MENLCRKSKFFIHMFFKMIGILQHVQLLSLFISWSNSLPTYSKLYSMNKQLFISIFITPNKTSLISRLQNPVLYMEENSLKPKQETLEITIRPIEESDIDDFMTWATDDRLSHFCLWDTFTSKEEALSFLTNNATNHPFFQVICVNDRAAGSISVTPRSGADICRAMISYALSYEYWGKGIALKAIKMVTCNIFKEWPHLERLEALVDDEHKASQRVLEKAGFMKEGVLRRYMNLKGRCIDVAVFSLLSCDPQLY